MPNFISSRYIAILSRNKNVFKKRIVCPLWVMIENASVRVKIFFGILLTVLTAQSKAAAQMLFLLCRVKRFLDYPSESFNKETPPRAMLL